MLPIRHTDMGDIGYDHPEYRPPPAPRPVECATQDCWDDMVMDEYALPDYAMKRSRFVYLDRVGPELFVGRYHHGVCDAVPADASKHTELDAEYGVVKNDYDFALRSRKDVLAVAARNHAYMVAITPDGSESRCLYCGTTMDGYEGETKSGKAWKGRSTGPGAPPRTRRMRWAPDTSPTRRIHCCIWTGAGPYTQVGSAWASVPGADPTRRCSAGGSTRRERVYL